MVNRTAAVSVGLVVLCCAIWPLPAGAQTAGKPATKPAVPVAAGVVVLDTQSSWRMYDTLQPPVIQVGDKLKTVQAGYFNDHPTAPPPADWTKTGFDDSNWVREAATRSCRTQTLCRLCLRGRFQVADPAKVDDLRLAVEYRGGVIVYLNGTEVYRGSIAAGAALADAYPAEAFVGKDAKVVGDRWNNDAESLRRIALRTRSDGNIALPRGSLVAGTNVLAIEIVRAPYDKALDDQKVADGKYVRYEMNWYTCQIERIELRAGSEAGLAPNATRPKGFGAWNADVLASDFDIQFGDPLEPLRPVEMSGARNGWFDGKVMVGCDGPIRGLKATASDLKGPQSAAIPASEIRIRYGQPWGTELLTLHQVSTPNPYPRGVTLMGAIADQPLAVYPVSQPRPRPAGGAERPANFERLGAVAPVWVTVHVPANAAAGDYVGQLTLAAEGEKPIVVPLKLKVIDWKLPDPQDYRTWVEMIQSPDTLAVEYDLPLWSNKHWQLIAQSMKYLNESGSRSLYLPLIAQNNLGAAESMVRWVKKGDGQYEYDFSVLEKYLDTALANMGKPKLLVFEVWEVYMIREDKYKDFKITGQPEATMQYRQAKNLMAGTGPVVTVLDKATGKTEPVTLADYADPGSKALWQPLLAELRTRMQKRGLEGIMALGTISDFPPTRGEVQFFKDIAPEMPWVIHSHHGGNSPYGLSKVIYQTRVWNNGFPEDPNLRRGHGWQNETLIANYQRESTVMSFPCSAWHNLLDMNIGGGQRGVGRLGLDFWQAIKDKNGQRKGTVANRYPQSSRRNLDLYSSMLAPGAEGPMATTRLEAFRQGVEESEARIFVDKALVDTATKAKLGADLAKRCQDCLDERDWCAIKGMSHLYLAGPGWLYGGWYDVEGPAGHIWFLGSGWRQRAEKLFALAGEVGQKLGGK